MGKLMGSSSTAPDDSLSKACVQTHDKQEHIKSSPPEVQMGSLERWLVRFRIYSQPSREKQHILSHLISVFVFNICRVQK